MMIDVGTRMWGLLSITWTILPPSISWRKVALDMVSQMDTWKLQDENTMELITHI